MGDDTVRGAYDENPFPSRDPEDELKQLIKCDNGSLRVPNSLFWGGKRPLDGFRVLDAGCGTGDAVIYMAEQLRGAKAEIVALDISGRSLDIVKKRAEKRGLGNIVYVEDTLANLESLSLGKFDYIICTSVLPHLDNPAKGLGLLSSSLKDDGGMLLQLYARYGRFGINLVQDICRILNNGRTELTAKRETAGKVMDALPTSHPLRRIRGYTEYKYDLVLEDRTMQFSVPELYDFVHSAGLDILRFRDGPLYEPGHYTGGKLEEASSLPRKDQEAIAELLNGTMLRHVFYASKKGFAAPALGPDDEKLVPSFKDEEQKIPDISEGEAMLFRVKEYNKPIKLERNGMHILRLIDGKRSIGSILDEAAQEASLPREAVKGIWLQIFSATRGSDFILLNLP